MNEKFAYVLDLHKYLEDNKIPLWLRVPAVGWDSVIGNLILTYLFLKRSHYLPIITDNGPRPRIHSLWRSPERHSQSGSHSAFGQNHASWSMGCSQFAENAYLQQQLRTSSRRLIPSIQFRHRFQTGCPSRPSATSLGWVLPANTLALINATIGTSPNITWVAISWTLGLAVGFTLVERLSDISGRRWFFIGTSVLDLVEHVIGASAQSINMLIATNCINGLAAAGQLSFHITLGELVLNAQRGPVNALILITSVPFAVFGPPVARALYVHTALQWRWSYTLRVIVNAIAVLLFFMCYHPPTYVSCFTTPGNCILMA